MNAAAVLQLDLVLLGPYVVAAVVHMHAAVLRTKPHGGLIEVLVDGAALEARRVPAERGTCRIRAWNVIRVRVVGARAVEEFVVSMIASKNRSSMLI